MDTQDTKFHDFAARLMLFMFHQLSSEWAQQWDTESGNGTGVFGSLTAS
jgi:hypothetical protein